MSPEKIKMAGGGERLDDVIGREEDEELPEFEDGAFVVDGGDGLNEKKRLGGSGGRDGLDLDEFLPAGEVLRHTMRGLVGSSLVVPSKDFLCDEVRFLFLHVICVFILCGSIDRKLLNLKGCVNDLRKMGLFLIW